MSQSSYDLSVVIPFAAKAFLAVGTDDTNPWMTANAAVFLLPAAGFTLTFDDVAMSAGIEGAYDCNPVPVMRRTLYTVAAVESIPIIKNSALLEDGRFRVDELFLPSTITIKINGVNSVFSFSPLSSAPVYGLADLTAFPEGGIPMTGLCPGYALGSNGRIKAIFGVSTSVFDGIYEHN